MTQSPPARQKMNPSIGAMLDPAGEFLTKTHALLGSIGLVPQMLGYGQTRFSFEVPDKFGDCDGWAQAGFLTIVLDSMMGVALFTTLEAFKPVATINLRTDYVQRIKCGTRATCACDYLANVDDVIFMSGRVIAEDSGDLIATGAGAFMVGAHGLAKGSRL